jgi:peptidoglycan/LPS O-acetylase OafA/YrhL
MGIRPPNSVYTTPTYVHFPCLLSRIKRMKPTVANTNLWRFPLEWLTQKFELSRGGGAHNVRPMEGLRGFAVFLVFLVHFVGLMEPWIMENSALIAFTRGLDAIGNTGVDLFFVLSGYLIYGSLIARPLPFVRFMSRRIQRIYPAFIAVFVIYIALSFVFPEENKIPAPATEGMIYLVQNFLLLPGLFSIEPIITVAWSLSYEMFYYLAIPLLITLFRLRDRSAIWRVSFFSIIAVATAIYCASYGGPVRLIMFVSGILLHEAMNSRNIPTPNSFFGLFALAFGLAATLPPMAESIKTAILFASFFVLCLACFRNPSTWLPRTFSWTPFRWLGNMSYSYYLLHGLALKAGFLVVAIVLPAANYGPWFFWALLPAMFALTLIPTAILFLAVERPLSLATSRAPGKASEAHRDSAASKMVRAETPLTVEVGHALEKEDDMKRPG